MAADVKHLYRSQSDRWLFGVCGGIGEYFSLDPTLIRAAFVILSLLLGGGLFIYIILIIVIPLEPVDATSETQVTTPDAAVDS